MHSENHLVIGIDVGGQKKGFHAVALKYKAILDKFHSTDSMEITAWCKKHQAKVIAIDAPCKWSQSRSSRQAERDLAVKGIHSFYTPTKIQAEGRKFYSWVFNGERLYQNIGYPIFDGETDLSNCCIETFPHAVQVALWLRQSQQVPSGKKSIVRRETLKKEVTGVSNLSNIDFVDAALCAVAADYFLKGACELMGSSEEGFIIIPSFS